MTKDPLEAPDLPVVVEIGFEEGTPVSVNHVPMGPVELLESLNATAGEHGGGRADVVEDRLGGVKSPGGYETPGGPPLPAAHREPGQPRPHPGQRPPPPRPAPPPRPPPPRRPRLLRPRRRTRCGAAASASAPVKRSTR